MSTANTSTTNYIHNNLMLSKQVELILIQLNNECLHYDRLTGDTYLLDAISSQLITSLEGCTFEHTLESIPESFDLDTISIEQIDPFISHLIDLKLIAKKPQ